MSFGTRLNFPYSTATTTSLVVPTIYDVAVAGRPFMVDTMLGTQDRSQWTHQSIPYLTKYLTSPVFGSPTSVAEVGETSLNPDVNWRRSAGAWHHGAGQAHFDLSESDRARFHQSKGIDCWTIGQLSLLPDTIRAKTVTGDAVLETAGDYLYVVDGSTVTHTTDLVTWTSAGVSTTVAGIASNGNLLWFALPAGIYQQTRGSTTVTLTNALTADSLSYVKGRLMASAGPSVFNITTTVLPTPAGLTVAAHGATGSTHYGYRVTACNAVGETLACTEVDITNGNATLSATNYNQLGWTAVAGATSYRVYGRVAGSIGFLDTASDPTYTDTGTATPGVAVPGADTTGVAPAPLWTHDNTDWAWTGWCAGDTSMYVAGYSGDQSAVYRIGIESDGTTLDPPVQAGELPRGETVLCLYAYLGLIFIGTTAGVRLATQASSGELQIGSVVPTGPCRDMSGFGQWVWFGWENIDSETTGLGRMDITVINTDAPAYALDLQAATQGQVPSVVTFNGKRLFTVAAEGVYQQSDDLVSSGWLDSGQITFDLPDPKVAQAITVLHSTPLIGSYTVSMATDNQPMISLGTYTPTSPDQPFGCSATKGAVFEIRLTLGRDPTNTTTGPSITRHTIMATPAALSGEQILIPLLVRSTYQPKRGSPVLRDCGDDLAFLTSLRKTKQSFLFQEGATAYRCVMQDWQFFPMELTPDRRAYEGTFVATLLHQDVGS